MGLTSFFETGSIVLLMSKRSIDLRLCLPITTKASVRVIKYFTRLSTGFHDRKSIVYVYSISSAIPSALSRQLMYLYLHLRKE